MISVWISANYLFSANSNAVHPCLQVLAGVLSIIRCYHEQ